MYHDGQFDDARLLINLAQTAVAHGAALLNYARGDGAHQGRDGIVDGVVARDVETGQEFRALREVVINATGPFADSVRRLAEPEARAADRAEPGLHLVFDRSFLPGEPPSWCRTRAMAG